MLDLVRFELKKLLVRRTSLIACAGILVMLCGIMALNVAQTRTTSNADEVLTGTAAIAHQKEKAVAHEGVLDADRCLLYTSPETTGMPCAMPLDGRQRTAMTEMCIRDRSRTASLRR